MSALFYGAENPLQPINVMDGLSGYNLKSLANCMSIIKSSKGVYIMGLFNKILGKLGIGKKDDAPKSASAALGAQPAPAAPAAAAKPAAPAKPAAKPAASAPKPVTVAPAPPSTPPPPAAPVTPAPVAISEVDVVKQLDELSKGKGLNWKVSIVDLLKLLDLDSSKEARIELAKELGCPNDLIGGDYSKMNIWLHKEVLKQIAANGGNIPKELLD